VTVTVNANEIRDYKYVDKVELQAMRVLIAAAAMLAYNLLDCDETRHRSKLSMPWLNSGAGRRMLRTDGSKLAEMDCFGCHCIVDCEAMSVRPPKVG
jgi:hypothetical protein